MSTAEQRSGTTRSRLLDAALVSIVEHGISGTSARTIAAQADVNQALVFYHFGSVDELLAAACRHGAESRVAGHRDRLAKAETLTDLLEIGRGVHAEEHASGNVAVLAQLLAGAQTDPRLAPATAAGMQLWVDEVEQVLHRILRNSPLAEVIDVPGLARALAAGFVGLELYEGVDHNGSERALAALEQLATLAAVLDEQGPLVRRLLRGHLRRNARG